MNNKLLFTAGIGVIVFLIMVLFRNVFSVFIFPGDRFNYDSGWTAFLNILLIMITNSVAFAFYLRYVGFIPITFHLMSKVVFISLVPPVILHLYDRYISLLHQIKKLSVKNEDLIHQMEQYQEDFASQTITLVTESKTENLEVGLADIIFLRSADNYVEIVHIEGDRLKKDLIRNTLKNIEIQLQSFNQFERCHRTCIVNVNYINKLIKSDYNYSISLKFTDEILPVSRQYLLRIKALHSN
ncbi:MAG: LytTR family transcriptional regulator DNA-binding domain-containing protein [Bacteroidetes bacterium]|nr:LytTR family transcriptional regulator DNA-binding domain-containing protein [Bacteroidota bacterium]